MVSMIPAAVKSVTIDPVAAAAAPLRGFPALDGTRSPSPAEGPLLALKPPENAGDVGDGSPAARCLATGGSAESKHRLWLFTPATGGRALPSASLCGRKPCTPQVARTSAEVRKPPPAAQLPRGTSPPWKIPQLSEGDEKI